MLPIPGTVVPELHSQCDAARRPPAPGCVDSAGRGYPSGHATLSNAAREVIERVYGLRHYSITVSTPTVPGVTLQYSKLKEITADIVVERQLAAHGIKSSTAAGAFNACWKSEGASTDDGVYAITFRP